MHHTRLLELVREEVEHGKITYPKDHQVGMLVPEGGSKCGNCKFFDEGYCGNKYWLTWNNGESKVPAPEGQKMQDGETYCCDHWLKETEE